MLCTCDASRERPRLDQYTSTMDSGGYVGHGFRHGHSMSFLSLPGTSSLFVQRESASPRFSGRTAMTPPVTPFWEVGCLLSKPKQARSRRAAIGSSDSDNSRSDRGSVRTTGSPSVRHGAEDEQPQPKDVLKRVRAAAMIRSGILASDADTSAEAIEFGPDAGAAMSTPGEIIASDRDPSPRGRSNVGDVGAYRTQDSRGRSMAHEETVDRSGADLKSTQAGIAQSRGGTSAMAYTTIVGPEEDFINRVGVMKRAEDVVRALARAELDASASQAADNGVLRARVSVEARPLAANGTRTAFDSRADERSAGELPLPRSSSRITLVSKRMYRVCISRLIRLERHREAAEILNRMWALGMSQPLWRVNRVIRLCGSSLDWQRAVQVFRALEQSGVAPDGDSYEAVIASCVKGGQPEMALRIFAEALEEVTPGQMTEGCFREAIRAYGTMGKWEEAVRVLEGMSERGAVPDQTCYRSACALSMPE